MSRRNRKNAPAAAPCTVTVCRGCCCGTPKIPGVDHAAQLAQLRGDLAGADGRIRVSDCVDACEHGNVIVVQPSAEGRAAGGRPVWLGLVNDPDATADIATWIRDGGPGLAEPPGVLDLYAFTPSRRVRQAVDA
ncbi:(2Fe-2S) ferredoxin domain-containing protein [Streptomyces sp. AV19]|uniref:(2Fe-2S) ferredoxin domain-containing protein n=1 Tax=Streptomyces sp. AV19 TaxID=2793068 RepID=UPI0018FEF003|nr:(2Fe-2S) ferredoxin domain-containing protein [Streptomyces sp. AV19]MBH1934211.1 (2Fe-2S) ferredoxin domain-containing protein [Streptomyces sp. AV19]MDG4533929.1 (2Fe-2S) ferredoxin domain-containing protein [Streptomyces sp. AV19]